jgi:N-acetylglucosaminyldiphosphoundecaprenol N-acetyl-beta-D-mannosaminyltransferase
VEGTTIDRQQLFGLPFVDAATIEPVVDELRSFDPAARPRALHVVLTPNVDYVVQFAHNDDADVAAIVSSAEWVLPDGQPIVWASRLLGRPLRARLPGSTLVAELWPHLLADGRAVLVVASGSAVAERVAAEAGASAAVVAPLLHDRAAVDAFAASLVAAIDPARPPAFVFVAFGFPRMAHLAHALHERWPSDVATPVYLLVGASFEMMYGMRKRAPHWAQRFGLEWLYRFAQEPRRLFVRYFVRDPYFVWLVAQEWWRMKRGGSGKPGQATGSP